MKTRYYGGSPSEVVWTPLQSLEAQPAGLCPRQVLVGNISKGYMAATDSRLYIAFPEDFSDGNPSTWPGPPYVNVPIGSPSDLLWKDKTGQTIAQMLGYPGEFLPHPLITTARLLTYIPTSPHG
jgi:hypothetical protein